MSGPDFLNYKMLYLNFIFKKFENNYLNLKIKFLKLF